MAAVMIVAIVVVWSLSAHVCHCENIDVRNGGAGDKYIPHITAEDNKREMITKHCGG